MAAYTALLAATFTANAQERAGAGAQSSTGIGLEEVVVTAQRRAERLQDVPIAISALSSEDLAKQGVTDLSSLRGTVPGLSIGGFAGVNASNLVSIRGVSGQPLPIGAGQATAIYLDGVYLSRPDAAFFGLDDVERIEVLRGPQGTLYGRNATAGAINIITREPGSDMQGGFDLSYGDFEAVNARGSLSGPLVGGLSAGISGSYEQRDGYFTNTVTGNTPGERESYTVRGKLRYSSTGGAFNATLAADQTESDALHFYKNVMLGTTYVGIGNPDTIASDVLSEQASSVLVRSRGTSLTMTYNVNDATQLTSITSFRDVRTDTVYDLDASATPANIASAANFSKTFNQELRATLSLDRLRLTAGVNYYHENANFSAFFPPTIAILSIPNPPRDPYDTTQLDAYAAFTQVEFDITDWLTVVGGLRYNKEERDFTMDYTQFARPTRGFFTQGSLEDDIVIPALGLNIKVAPDVLLYLKASQGYQAPGFNVAPGPFVGADTFDAEELWSYEVGVKSQFLDRRITFNAAAFYYDYKDIQIRSVTGIGITTIDNAAAATLQGAETSLTFVPIDGLTLGGQFTYLDAQYDDFCEATSGGAPRGNDPLCPSSALANRSGNALLQAPEWSGSANVGYRLPIGNLGELGANASYTWQSNSYFTTANEVAASSGAWGNLSARFSFQFSDGPEIYVYGKNLEDERYVVWAGRASDTLSIALMNDPRTYGLGIRYSF
jgi:iron complex outermembrane receptor protein